MRCLPLRFLLTLSLFALLLSGCSKLRGARERDISTRRNPSIHPVALNDLSAPVSHDGPIVISGARNETVSFAVELKDLGSLTGKRGHVLELRPPQLTNSRQQMALSVFSAHQVLSAPIDVNRAAYVRQTGLPVGERELPRALLPVPMSKGRINLSNLRNPRDATNPASRAAESPDEPLLLWFDLHIPADATAGEYVARCNLLQSRQSRASDSIQIKLNVHDFDLPAERNLLMVSRLQWDDLVRLYPRQFEAVRPPLLSRSDTRYEPAIQVLDQLTALAQKHRTQVVVPRLGPIVKWLPNRPPLVDWQNFDSVVEPWMGGQSFADQMPLAYWPLPGVDYLASYDLKSRLEYWSEAAMHFDERQWLTHSAVFMEKSNPGRAGTVESIRLSADAAEILSVHPRVRVTLPLEDDQLHFAGEANPNLLEPTTTSRLIASTPGLVFAAPIRVWPDGVKRPQRWLRTDLPGLVPYLGAGGDQRDVRLWAWLAFLRQASLILWDSPLPRTNFANEPAEPGDLVWFYPGAWFGVHEPVPTIQLKWLRRAQQDYEYLWLARQRGNWPDALLLARLITKPIEIQPTQHPDPAYALMCGTSDQAAWDEAQQLLARAILLRQPGAAVDERQRHELNLQMLRWAETQERPMLIGRTTRWLAEAGGGAWVNLRLGIDIYNASDAPGGPNDNQLQWTDPGPWQVEPRPMKIGPLATYRVRRFEMDARVNLDALSNQAQKPIELTFADGYHKRESKLRIAAPVAASQRRRPGLLINGRLDDWHADDVIHAGPLVCMLNRPALQQQEMQLASTDSKLYSGWSDEQFYLAFELGGVAARMLSETRNFVDYDFRRAWGEDLCQILIQPVYQDNTLGPVLHVVCKPTGNWIERKSDPRLSVDPWQALDGSGIRYHGRVDNGWRGEVAIPWKAIMGTVKGRPRLLRFNFTQHKHDTGESASWAGPIDFGRDESFTGLLYLREADEPGMAGGTK